MSKLLTKLILLKREKLRVCYTPSNDQNDCQFSQQLIFHLQNDVIYKIGDNFMMIYHKVQGGPYEKWTFQKAVFTSKLRLKT